MTSINIYKLYPVYLPILKEYGRENRIALHRLAKHTDEYLIDYLGDNSITGNQLDIIYEELLATDISADEKAMNDYCKLHDC